MNIEEIKGRLKKLDAEIEAAINEGSSGLADALIQDKEDLAAHLSMLEQEI